MLKPRRALPMDVDRAVTPAHGPVQRLEIAEAPCNGPLAAVVRDPDDKHDDLPAASVVQLRSHHLRPDKVASVIPHKHAVHLFCHQAYTQAVPVVLCQHGLQGQMQHLLTSGYTAATNN